jgi:peptide deformylase
VLVWALPASLDCLVSERPDGNVLTVAATTLEDMAEQGQVKTDELDAQAEAKRRLALAQIRQYPDPVLRLEAQGVQEFDSDLAQLVERMMRLMRDARGVGLAANQVGVLRRVFVIQADEEEEPRALVNPVVVERSEESDVDDEGCLSLQGVVVPVERALHVRVEGRDPDGNPVSLELEGLPARVAQHELDHLDGVLILDRTTAEGRREALAVLRQAAAL